MLVKTSQDFYVPIKRGRPYGYSGKSCGYLWPKNIHEITVNKIRGIKFDLIILQIGKHVKEEQFKILSKEQGGLPKIFIFHTPPQGKKSYKKFSTEDIKGINAFVHVTEYNLKHWVKIFSGIKNRSRVIYHGVEIDKRTKWSGKIKKSVTAINDLYRRPECGNKMWQAVVKKAPNVLIGGNSERLGGIGVVENKFLRKEFSKYRAYFNPTKRSSTPLTMLEAMSVGLPVVSTAGMGFSGIIKNGINGFTSNNVNTLAKKINLLVEDKKLAQRLGENAQKTIRDKFSVARFVRQWNDLFNEVIRKHSR